MTTFHNFGLKVATGWATKMFKTPIWKLEISLMYVKMYGYFSWHKKII